MLKKRFFGSDYIDEIELKNNAYKINLDFNNINDIQKEYGLNIATYALYNTILKKHESFINEINAIPATIDNIKNNNIKILIIPGMYYKEYPEIGGDGKFIKSIAEKFLFNVDIINTNSKGSVLENVRIIDNDIRNHKDKDIWLISFSRGSAEVRLWLEQNYNSEILANIKGWINISGIIKGSVLFNINSDNIFKKFLTKIFLKIIGINPQLLDNLRTDFWQKDFIIPNNMKVIHITGVPILAHMSPSLIRRYENISEYGPNDGIVLLKDLLNVEGNVYPMWSVDHFLRSNLRGELIYKLCNYININN